ncbi:DUF5808 domain-containing protein [Pedobacter mendelii]|uniref:DUF5808 domain-containing protein n=1 Tax=Pedobacter mendelii TaxID=1908240 RepID=A0ABQ2BGS2_9SPHI|nr:DUF5808 domain-containing protein [Pedobacter mendelii]GGI25734.1 hypothetical protein GCM10008119_19150 [Pedobacter mendelii]
MKKDFQYDNPENWKWGIFYCNRKDSRFIVPKQIEALGWTLNFAHPISYILISLIFAFVAYKIYG